MQALVVDDDPAIRETLCQLLLDEGYDVVEAGDGVEALAKMAVSEEPMVALLDLQMARMNGEQTLLAALEREELRARIAFIIVTANPQFITPRLREALARDDIPVTLKPFDTDQLTDLVAHMAVRLGQRVVAR